MRIAACNRRSTPHRLSDTYAELENTGTTIESNFAPEHADLIQGQRKKQKRAERRTKRGLLMLGGWSLNALMIYLIWVTARTVTKIWDPYDVLGVSRVRVSAVLCCFCGERGLTHTAVCRREVHQEALPKTLAHTAPRQSP